MTDEKRKLLKWWFWITFWFVFVVLFMWLVFPTKYRYASIGATPIRINRFTDRAEYIDWYSKSWEPIGSNFDYYGR